MEAGGFLSDIACPQTDRGRNGLEAVYASTRNRAGPQTTSWTRETLHDFRKPDQADFLEFVGNNVLVERLHDVFIGASLQRARDVGDVILGGAEHHLRHVAARQAAKV